MQLCQEPTPPLWYVFTLVRVGQITKPCETTLDYFSFASALKRIDARECISKHM
jgi:hypothetical protein